MTTTSDVASASSSSFDEALSPLLAHNKQWLQYMYSDCSDVVIQDVDVLREIRGLLIYIDGLTNVEATDRDVLRPLAQAAPEEGVPAGIAGIRSLLSVSALKEVRTFHDVTREVALGNPVLLLDGDATGLSFGLAQWDKRTIDEPMAESVIRGPREGFTETLNVNTSLLRRRLRTPAFKTKAVVLGRYSHTRVVMAFLDKVADLGLLAEIESRLHRIDIDGILESGNIEEMIEDNTWSPFPQMLTTERPDIAASAILEGRVVLLVEGTPIVIVAPTTLFALLQSAEDYYQRYTLGTAIRWLRYGFLLVALLAPSMYVAILTYHQEMIPTTLLLSIAESREQIPFPALIEAFLMEITFEALREAGVRLPKQVGAAVSIVGALVIGQAATAAGLVSAPMVMIVAITGIASFMIPHYSFGISIRLLRFPIMLLAGMLGLLGLLLGVIVVVIHLCGLRSFGVPYLTPVAPMMRREWKDVFARVPIWKLNTRPKLNREDRLSYRQSRGNKPNSRSRDER